MRKRAEEKIRDAEDEVVNVLEHKPQEPWLEKLYRPVGKYGVGDRSANRSLTMT